MNDTVNYQWTVCTHPEGSLYFLAESASQSLKIFTDGDLTNPTIRNLVETAIDALLQLAQSQSISISHTELVIELLATNLMGYYFVETPSRSVFWLRDFKASLLRGNFGWFMHIMLSSTQITHLDEFRYHCACYPHSDRVSSLGDITNELEYYVVYALGDVTASASGSTSPYSKEELRDILSILDLIKAKPYSHYYMSLSGELNYSLFIAMFMRTFVTSKFLNFHGQVGARLSADQSVYMQEDSAPTKLKFNLPNLVLALGRLCFSFVSIRYRRKLEETFIGDQISRESWKLFVESLSSDWKAVVLNSALILNANIAFLAVPGVIATDPNTLDIIQAFSHVSIIFSFLSGIAGLFLYQLVTFRIGSYSNRKGTVRTLSPNPHLLTSNPSSKPFPAIPEVVRYKVRWH
ncbi:hypothetical protein M422DRAFT_56181 [Sphaerobolus stellatus SS14]|uniref:Uncharacterized protein n=1 Tax=Sphaerobolus stellatus (strain SS14) TaxID=990650 RepID=A0A0C9T7J4_SPHS4|nr:hypothetical protein M422DRAFT_56181 [Sphaerobolus stellatus SS14]